MEVITTPKRLPSQRVFARQYDAWAILQKDKKNGEIFTPGGKIISAYCTCTARLLSITITIII